MGDGQINETDSSTKSRAVLKRIFDEARLPVMAQLMEERRLIFIMSAVGAIQIVLVWLNLPSWQCPFRAVTGRPCPGCGLSRAMMHLLGGRWDLALELHPFSPFFLVAWVMLVITAFLPASLRQTLISRTRSFETRTGLTSIFLIAFFAYGIARAAGII